MCSSRTRTAGCQTDLCGHMTLHAGCPWYGTSSSVTALLAGKWMSESSAHCMSVRTTSQQGAEPARSASALLLVLCRWVEAFDKRSRTLHTRRCAPCVHVVLELADGLLLVAALHRDHVADLLQQALLQRKQRDMGHAGKLAANVAAGVVA